MSKNKNQKSTKDSVLKPQNSMTAYQMNRNSQTRKNNMNYTNINKNRGK